MDTCTDYTAAGSFADIAKNVQYLPEPDYALLVRTMDIKSKFTKGKLVFVNKHAYEYLWRVHMDSNCIILPNIGANCGEVYYIQVKDLPDIPCVLGPNAILGRSTECNLKYVFYCLNGHDFQRKLAAIISPGGQTKYNKTNLKMLEIPVPPIPVQDEIVRILDEYTDLEVELEAKLSEEIDNRQKQYAYYVDMLFAHADGMKEYTVQDLVSSGLILAPFDGNHGELHPKKSDYVAQGVPFVMANDLENGRVNYSSCAFITEKQVGTLRKGFARPKDVLLTHKGTIGRTAIVSDEYDLIILTPQVTAYRIVNGINEHYLKYYFDSKFFQDVINEMCESSGTRAYVGIKAQCKLPILLCDMDEQERIVKILDKYDTYTRDMISTLNTELESRKKQYAYYRDQLLTFKRKEV